MRNVVHGVVLSTILFALLGWADGGHKEEGSGRIGPNFAVTAFDKEEGFKLSDQALATLTIKFAPLQGKGPWTIAHDALVTLKKSTAVYRRYQGFITLVLVKVTKQTEAGLVITSQDLEPNDEIAISGVPFLRMVDADLNSETTDGCAH